MVVPSALAPQRQEATVLPMSDDEIAALDLGMAWARPGDLIAVLVHIQRDEVQRWLELKGS